MAESADPRPTAPARDLSGGLRKAAARGAAGWSDALGRALMAERDRWFLWLPVAFGAGIGIYFRLSLEPAVWIGPAGLALALAAGLLGRGRMGPLVAALALGAAAAGFTAAQLRTAEVAAPVLEKRLGPVTLVARLREAAPRPAAGRVVLQTPRIEGLAPERTPARLRLRLTPKEDAVLEPGDWLRVRAILRPPSPPVAPGAFDFARRAYFKRIGAVGFAVSRVTVLDGPPDWAMDNGSAVRSAAFAADVAADWNRFWNRLRQSVAGRVLDALPGTAGGVAAALMTGKRGAIPEAVRDDMRDSGLAHLLAISGLHMGLVAGLLFLILRRGLALAPAVALRYPIKKWAAVAAGLGCFVYLFLAGATVPSQRAFAMVLLVLLAVLLDRAALSPRLVAWAAFAVLLMAPESLLAAGFQMSFSAVIALIAAYELVSARRWSSATDDARRVWVRRAAFYLAGVAFTSIIAILATTPFALYHFNRLVTYGLAANMVAVPLTAIWIMPCAILAFALMPLGLEGLALAPMGWGIETLLAVARGVAGWPGAVTPVQAMPPAGLVLIAGGGLWLCIWRRWWRVAGLAAVAAGFLTLAFARPPDLLASDDGKLLGLRDPAGGLWLSSAGTARYVAETWARRLGTSRVAAWPRDGSTPDGPADNGRLRCDSLGCIYRPEAGAWTVALVEDARALFDDCAVADVVISLEPVRGRACRGPRLVVDRFDLWRSGAHAVWLTEEGAKVRHVAGERGERPWTESVRRPRRD